MGSLQQITTEFSIHSTLYSVKGADKRTAFTPDVETITVPITLFHADYLLLTTPSEPQVCLLSLRLRTGQYIWECVFSYRFRNMIAHRLFVMCLSLKLTKLFVGCRRVLIFGR